MKLGISINTFEGTELIEPMIREIRNCVDLIIISYQNYSYYGQHIKESDLSNIAHLQESKLIDGVLCFDPANCGYAHNPREAKHLERIKRSNSIHDLVGMRCTHFIVMDSERVEFYKSNEFLKAKDLIINSGIYFSACKIKEYVNKPIYQLEGFEDVLVPFICKAGNHLKYDRRDFMGLSMDPTRCFDTIGYPCKVFGDHIQMHHYNNIRQDLTWKYEVTSRSNLDRQNIPAIVQSIRETKEGDYYKGRKIVSVPNYFGIEIEKKE